jgi:hypothetical protein
VQLSSTPGISAELKAAAAAPVNTLMPCFDFSHFCFGDDLSDLELVANGRSFKAHR